MKKISIVLLFAVLFTACLKDVSVTNPLSENRVVTLPYYFMGPIKTNFALDSTLYGFRDLRGYYNEQKREGLWMPVIQVTRFLPDYRSIGTTQTRFTCSKLGIDTTVTLQDYGTIRYLIHNSTGYFNPTDTSKNVWGRCFIRNSSKVIVNDTVVVSATTSWIQPLQTIKVSDTIRIIFK